MEFLIAYLLFAAVVDLLLEIVGMKAPRHTSIAIHRRLWNDSLFDCRSRAFSLDRGTLRRSSRLPGGR